MPKTQCSDEADWYVLIQVNPEPRATITKLQCPKSRNFEIFVKYECRRLVLK